VVIPHDYIIDRSEWQVCYPAMEVTQVLLRLCQVSKALQSLLRGLRGDVGFVFT
jgi:hypothetical protein